MQSFNYTALTSLFDFFLPRFCPSCDKKLLPNESIVCPDCISKIKLAEDERIHSEFVRKFSSSGIISDFISLYVFEKDKELQHIIHSLKYNKRFLTGKFLGSILGKNLKQKIAIGKLII